MIGRHLGHTFSIQLSHQTFRVTSSSRQLGFFKNVYLQFNSNTVRQFTKNITLEKTKRTIYIYMYTRGDPLKVSKYDKEMSQSHTTDDKEI